MKRNVGTVDRYARIIASLAIFAFLFKEGSIAPSWPFLLPVALVLIATAFFSFCPLYTLFGWSTANNSRPAS